MNGHGMSRGDLGEFRSRYKYLAWGTVAAFTALIVRLFQLQVLEGDSYRANALDNITRKVRIPTTRGVIRDAYGRVLAASRPGYDLHVVPGRVLPSARKRKRARDVDTLPRVAQMLHMKPDEHQALEARIREVCADDGDRSPCWRPILVREDIARDVLSEVRQHSKELTGVEVAETAVRTYPYGRLGAHMLGYVSELDREHIAEYRPEGYESMSAEERAKKNPLGYEPGDTSGATGIEHAWEAQLRGQRGWQKRVVNAQGTYQVGPEADAHLAPPLRSEPIAGRDIKLSIDMDLMSAIDKAMRNHVSGAVVVVDVHTGRLRALYSKPTFDPNELSGAGGRDVRREAMSKLLSDPMHPLLDRTLTGAFQPGSTFKPFSAMAALEGKLVDPKARETCTGGLKYGGRWFKCSHVHGTVDMNDAIAESCNVYFFRLSEAVGLDRIAATAQSFGLGEKTGLAVNPEAPGNVPNRAWYSLRYRGQFHIGFTLNTSIGQGAATVNPVQLAMAYAAIGNGGTLYAPEIVTEVGRAETGVVQTFAPREVRKVDVSADTLARMQKALWAVVNDPKGTAYPVRDARLDISGKTGTAQTGYVPAPGDDPKQAWFYARDHAWFASLYPAKAPEIAVIALIEHGGAGPTQAAPVAIQVVRDYVRLAAERAAAAPRPAP